MKFIESTESQSGITLPEIRRRFDFEREIIIRVHKTRPQKLSPKQYPYQP
jgi:hypothetical protein